MTIIENATCPSCNEDTMYKHKHRLGTLEFCPKCCHQSTPDPVNDCSTHHPVPCKATQSNGRPYVKMQCKSCGESHGSNGIKVKECVNVFNTDKEQYFWMLCNDYNANRMKFERAIQDFYHKNGGKYQYYLKSEAWQRKRLQCFERDNNECTECGSKTHLQAHHLTYVRLGNENLNDLQTLCRACHNAKHDRTF